MADPVASAIALRVPKPVAELLLQSGQAARRRSLRSPVPQIVAEGIEVAALTITLLQGPVAVRDLAQAIRAWVRSFLREPENDLTAQPLGVVSHIAIRVTLPNGEFALEVNDDTSVDAIVRLLNETIFSGAPETS